MEDNCFFFDLLMEQNCIFAKKKSMRIYLFLFLLVFITACSNDQTKTPTAAQKAPKKMDRASLLAGIDKLEKTFKQDDIKAIDYTKAQELIDQTILYAQNFPQDSITPELLFRTAQVARATKAYGRAIQMLGKVHREFPDNQRSPTALFLQAFIFENHLNDKDQAKKYYGHFLDKFPDNQLAPQVTQILKVIDKSAEELVKEFQKKNK